MLVAWLVFDRGYCVFLTELTGYYRIKNATSVELQLAAVCMKVRCHLRMAFKILPCGSALTKRPGFTCTLPLPSGISIRCILSSICTYDGHWKWTGRQGVATCKPNCRLSSRVTCQLRHVRCPHINIKKPLQFFTGYRLANCYKIIGGRKTALPAIGNCFPLLLHPDRPFVSACLKERRHRQSNSAGCVESTRPYSTYRHHFAM